MHILRPSDALPESVSRPRVREVTQDVMRDRLVMRTMEGQLFSVHRLTIAEMGPHAKRMTSSEILLVAMLAGQAVWL